MSTDTIGELNEVLNAMEGHYRPAEMDAIRRAAAEIRRLREENERLRDAGSHEPCELASAKSCELAKAAGRNEEWERPCVCGHIAYWRCGECGRNRKRAEGGDDDA